MKYYININNTEIKLRDISSFSFEEYNTLLGIFEVLDVEKQYKLLYKLFTPLDFEEIEQIENLFAINFKEILAQPIRLPIKTIFEKPIKLDLDEISFGKFVDLEYFIGEEIERIENVCSILLLKDYSPESFALKKEEVIKHLPIGKALTLFEVYTAFRKKFYKDYEGLFKESGTEPEEPEDIELPVDAPEPEFKEEVEGPNWGLLELAYHATNGDILKLDKILEQPLFKFMNFLSWQKEQSDKQEAEMHLKNNIVKH